MNPSLKLNIKNRFEVIYSLGDILMFFRLYETNLGRTEMLSLRAKILNLSEDESVRSCLEPAFEDFVKKPALHPTNIAVAVLLSIL